MSLTPVDQGQLAAVVTYLEMTSPPRAAAAESSLNLARVEATTTADYRDLFQLVGAPWLWFSRLVMSDAELAVIINDPLVDLFEVRDGDVVVGMLELDRRNVGDCELAFVGLTPAYSGKGHGRWLLNQAVAKAWAPGVRRVHVHTCSLDHPAALAAYQRAGFVAIRRAVETFIDPRLHGILPRDVAPQVPLIGDASTC